MQAPLTSRRDFLARGLGFGTGLVLGVRGLGYGESSSQGSASAASRPGTNSVSAASKLAAANPAADTSTANSPVKSSTSRRSFFQRLFAVPSGKEIAVPIAAAALGHVAALLKDSAAKSKLEYAVYTNTGVYSPKDQRQIYPLDVFEHYESVIRDGRKLRPEEIDLLKALYQAALRIGRRDIVDDVRGSDLLRPYLPTIQEQTAIVEESLQIFGYMQEAIRLQREVESKARENPAVDNAVLWDLASKADVERQKADDLWQGPGAIAELKEGLDPAQGPWLRIIDEDQEIRIVEEDLRAIRRELLAHNAN